MLHRQFNQLQKLFLISLLRADIQRCNWPKDSQHDYAWRTVAAGAFGCQSAE